LDLESVEWLEKFLVQQKNIPMVIVSHDRDFLDQVGSVGCLGEQLLVNEQRWQ
jgi:ATPase subunit of ABC transporter with duplicated ATPase domains